MTLFCFDSYGLFISTVKAVTRPWDFNAPVTADMTLYAAWQPLPAAAPSAGPWAWLIVGASISALTVLALRRRRRS